MSPSQARSNASDGSADEQGFESLSWTSFGICLAIVLGIFLALNPLWEPIDMAAMDQNIWWSYAPIPLLVLGFLALERKLGTGAFLIETMRLTFVKFVITFLAANILWVLTEPPGPFDPAGDPAATATAASPRAPRQAPVDSAIDPALTGSLSGTVVGADGTPVDGALVWVSDGLHPRTFAPPAATVAISADGRGFSPDPAIVRAFQPVTLHSCNGVLHTVSGTDDTGRRVFNIPVSPTAYRSLTLDRAYGLLSLACEVHRGAEPVAHALVTDNPFSARTGPDGTFAFTRVPSGELELSAWIPSGGTLVTTTTVRAGETVRVRFAER